MDVNECLVGGECWGLDTKKKLAAAPIEQQFLVRVLDCIRLHHLSPRNKLCHDEWKVHKYARCIKSVW